MFEFFFTFLFLLFYFVQIIFMILMGNFCYFLKFLELLEKTEDEVYVVFELVLEMMIHIFPDRFKIWKFENKRWYIFEGFCLLVLGILMSIGIIYNRA